MKTNSAPRSTRENLATESLVTAVESAIVGIEQRLPYLAADTPNAKCSVSDLAKLLQLREQLQGQRPRTIRVCWVDDPEKYMVDVPRDLRNDNNQPQY
jgi:hypothetical protein